MGELGRKRQKKRVISSTRPKFFSLPVNFHPLPLRLVLTPTLHHVWQSAETDSSGKSLVVGKVWPGKSVTMRELESEGNFQQFSCQPLTHVSLLLIYARLLDPFKVGSQAKILLFSLHWKHKVSHNRVTFQKSAIPLAPTLGKGGVTIICTFFATNSCVYTTRLLKPKLVYKFVKDKFSANTFWHFFWNFATLLPEQLCQPTTNVGASLLRQTFWPRCYCQLGVFSAIFELRLFYIFIYYDSIITEKPRDHFHVDTTSVFVRPKEYGLKGVAHVEVGQKFGSVTSFFFDVWLSNSAPEDTFP